MALRSVAPSVVLKRPLVRNAVKDLVNAINRVLEAEEGLLSNTTVAAGVWEAAAAASDAEDACCTALTQAVYTAYFEERDKGIPDE